MMKKITITRHRQFTGGSARCWIIFNMNEDEARKHVRRAKKNLPNQSKNVIPILNGQSITVELHNNKTEFYAAFMVGLLSNKVTYSNKVTVNESCADEAYVLDTASKQLTSTVFELTEI